jgi:hypothetical protein
VTPRSRAESAAYPCSSAARQEDSEEIWLRVRYRDPIGPQRSRSCERKADAQRFLIEMESDTARG